MTNGNTWSVFICIAITFYLVFFISFAVMWGNDYDCSYDSDCPGLGVCYRRACTCSGSGCDGRYYYGWGYDNDGWFGGVFFFILIASLCCFCLTPYYYLDREEEVCYRPQNTPNVKKPDQKEDEFGVVCIRVPCDPQTSVRF